MFNTALIWVSAMCWHLWRIVTFRPAFKHLSDTYPMVLSFIALYFGAGLLRWVALNDNPEAALWKSSLGLLLYMLVIFAGFERRDRSSSLTATVLGASAALDLLVCFGYLLGVLDSVRLPFFAGLALEMSWTLAAIARFNLEPAAVRRSGYRLAEHRKTLKVS